MNLISVYLIAEASLFCHGGWYWYVFRSSAFTVVGLDQFGPAETHEKHLT
jgi:hypothetical protein